jgi:proteasome lid subunit RPN8/RPN11
MGISNRLFIPRALWQAAGELMQPYFDRRVEAGCFLFGCRSDSMAALLVGIPRQTNSPYNFQIGSDDLAELVASLPEGATAVAQIHTHPGTATTHSETDDERAISTKICSLVVPKYGRLPWALDEVGVHVFDGGWRKLSRADAGMQVSITRTVVDTR